MLIKDQHFRILLDEDGSSPNPQKAIWRGQHQCVIEGFADDDDTPEHWRCGQIVIKHQLAGNRGHFSVLDHAFIKLDTAGFPHSVLCQLTRHRDSAFLVQSGRYTGRRFVKVATGDMDVEEAFYFRPVGNYRDRQGKHYEYTEARRELHKQKCIEACEEYTLQIDDGYSEEHARDCIPYNFRQNFCISGTIKDFFHWLDQRTKADSQIEIQTLAAMAFSVASDWSPELMAWYKTNRYGRALLAP